MADCGTWWPGGGDGLKQLDERDDTVGHQWAGRAAQAERPAGLARRKTKRKWNLANWAKMGVGPESRNGINGLQKLIFELIQGFDFKIKRFKCFQTEFELNSK
jgi:hypothetical protein